MSVSGTHLVRKGTQHRAKWHENGNRGEGLMRGRTTRRGGAGGLEKSCNEEKVGCEGKRVSCEKKKKIRPTHGTASWWASPQGFGDEVALLVLCVGHRRGWGVKCRP